MGRLENKIAVITGSSSGFGREIALGFAAEGAKIVCADIQPSPGAHETKYPNENTDAAIRRLGGEAIFVVCDVTDSDSVAALIRTAAETYGRIDTLVNNAGVGPRWARIDELDDHEWERVMGVNAKGVYNGCMHAIRQFLAQGGGGNIVNICSVGGVRALRMETVYCASKGAVANMTRTIAIDYAKDKIRVNAICPYFCRTGMTNEAYEHETMHGKVADGTPMGRWMEPEEIVGPALFLACDRESSYVTGHMLMVDGGSTAR
jgi:NAD(P)-dependent dehydrogenase (short-subunit alcohol dehydrogenase family)